MNPPRTRLSTLILQTLLSLLLALPAAATAAPLASTDSTDCLPGDGGDPGTPPCGQTAPASQDDDDKVEQGAGNPINVITGNKYQRETDLPALPGVLGIEIVRHYNSTQAGTNAPLGLLGRGWRLSYETDLYVLGRELHIVQADGKRLIFAPDPADARRHIGTDPMRGAITATHSHG